MPPKVDPTEVRYSTSFSTQSTSRFSAVSPVPQPPSLPSLAPWVSMQRRSVKTSSRKVASGRASV